MRTAPESWRTPAGSVQVGPERCQSEELTTRALDVSMTAQSIENWRAGRSRRRILVARVDPAAVQDNYVKRTWFERARFYGASLGLPWYRRRGDWDLRCRPFRDHPTFRFMQEFYRSGFDPAATERYHELCQRAQRRDGTESPDEKRLLDDMIEYIDRQRVLFESMQQDGYRSGMARDEIGFAIARDGRLVKTANGNHRMVVAQLLELDSVTVELRYVHERWYRKHADGPRHGFRQRIAEGLRSIPGILDVSAD